MALMLDQQTLFGILAILPLLQIVDVFIFFAQKRDVYIDDFVVALLILKGANVHVLLGLRQHILARQIPYIQSSLWLQPQANLA